MRFRSTSPIRRSPVHSSRAGASATRSRPPKEHSGCARMSRRRGSGLGCTGRLEVERLRPRARGVFLTDEETAALLRELDGLIDGDRYFMSPRIKTLKAIRAKIRPEPVREPLPPPPKQYAPPRATAKQRRRAGR